ncbi:hypothetical protein ABPG72_001364 [Tetrahymena utriculariae]
MDDDNHSIYLIDSMKQDTLLGQENFLTGTLRTCRARAKTFTSAIKISRNKFIEIIKNNESEYEKFTFLKDKMFLYQNYDSIKINCYICNKFSHLTIDCSLVHFDKNESFNKMDYLEKVKQYRSKHQRSKQKAQNALLIIKQMIYASKQLIQNSNIDILGKENEVSEISIESQFCQQEVSIDLNLYSQEIKKSDENFRSKDVSPTINKNQLQLRQEDEKD